MELYFLKSETKGVRLTHKNGYIDDYDPVVSFKVLDGLFYINNTCHTYTVPLVEVNTVEIYDRVVKVDEDFDDITWYEDENFETIWESVK